MKDKLSWLEQQLRREPNPEEVAQERRRENRASGRLTGLMLWKAFWGGDPPSSDR